MSESKRKAFFTGATCNLLASYAGAPAVARMPNKPPTLRETIERLGGKKAKVPHPAGGAAVEVDLSQFDDRDPDRTHIVFNWSSRIPELEGSTREEQLAYYQEMSKEKA